MGGFEGILHQCLLTAVIFSIAGILHIFVPVVLFFIVFGSFRTAAGGLHLNTSLKCTVATTSIMIFGTKAALAISLNLGISVIVFCPSTVDCFYVRSEKIRGFARSGQDI